MNLEPGQPVRIGMLSCPSHLPIVRAAIEKTCELLGMDEKTAGNVVLSVDEALTNIIRHAYEGACDKPIEVELAPIGAGRTPDALRIRLLDSGRSTDPSRIKGRDLKDVRPGGLGVHIIRKCMDSVNYVPRDGGGTELTMIKKLNLSDSQETP